MNRNQLYLLFTVVVVAIATSTWWSFVMLRFHLAISASLLMGLTFLGLFCSRYYYTRHFVMLIIVMATFVVPGFVISRETLLALKGEIPGVYAMPFVTLGLTGFVLIRGDYKFLRIALVVSLVAIAYTTYKTAIADVNSSRVFVANAANLEMLAKAVDNMEQAVMSYAHIHAMPFILVGLVCVGRRADKLVEKCIAVGMCLFCFYALLKSGYTAASLCTGIAVGMSFISARRRKVSLILMVIFGLSVFVLVQSGALLKILEYGVKPLLDPKSDLVGKINEFADMMTTANGSDYWHGRSYRYQMSWNAFLHNPLFGSGLGSEGGHAYLLDLLGAHGVFYFIPYLVYFFGIFKFVYRSLPKDVQWYYFSACFSLTIMLCFKAHGLLAQNYVMCFVLPLLLLVRKEDFYLASDLMRRQFRLPPRGWGRA